VHMQTVLALVLAAIRPAIIVVVIGIVTVVVLVAVAEMNMVPVSMSVGMSKDAGKCTDRRSKGHANARRKGEYHSRSPGKGNAASAFSRRSHHHRFTAYASGGSFNYPHVHEHVTLAVREIS
jgi:hypothetical protein